LPFFGSGGRDECQGKGVFEVTEGATRHEALRVALWEIACSVAAACNVEVVDLLLRGSSKRRILRVDIDRAGPQGVDVGDCARMSEQLGRALEETELIEQSYNLEVSSPGIDRPIRTEDDVRRNTGRRVVVHTIEPIEGQRVLRGVLEGLSGGVLRLCGESGQSWSVPLDVVEKAQQDVGF